MLGPNGAGKTTCFYSIMGLINPDFGKIKFNGIDITNIMEMNSGILTTTPTSPGKEYSRKTQHVMSLQRTEH